MPQLRSSALLEVGESYWFYHRSKVEYQAVVMGQSLNIRFLTIRASSNRVGIALWLSPVLDWTNTKLYLTLVNRSDILQAMISKDCSCCNPYYFFGIILFYHFGVPAHLLGPLTNSQHRATSTGFTRETDIVAGFRWWGNALLVMKYWCHRYLGLLSPIHLARAETLSLSGP